jgi:hypothetical protein
MAARRGSFKGADGSRACGGLEAKRTANTSSIGTGCFPFVREDIELGGLEPGFDKSCDDDPNVRVSVLPAGLALGCGRRGSCHVVLGGAVISFRRRLAGEGPSSPLSLAPVDEGREPSDMWMSAAGSNRCG